MVAEYANNKWRGASVAIMAAGYPVGAIVGGSVATGLLADGSWRDVFTFGAIVPTAFIPLVLWLTPESVGYLLQKRPAGVLEKLNRALRGVGHDPVATIPAPEADAPKSSPAELFAPRLRSITLLLTLGYFLHIMTFYFILKWVPKIVVDMGFSPSLAGGVLV